MRPWKVLAAEAAPWLLVTALLLAGLLVLVPVTGDGGTYSCRKPPAWLLIHPATEESPAFRRDFFDEGYQCNQDARRRAMMAGATVVIGSLPFILLRRRRLKLCATSRAPHPAP
jgi:hypothetical protein